MIKTIIQMLIREKVIDSLLQKNKNKKQACPERIRLLNVDEANYVCKTDIIHYF